MLSRRMLLSAALPLAGAPRVRPRPGCQTNAWPIDPRQFGEVLAVLDKIKGLGYEGFETGYRNVEGRFASARQTRQELDARGLKFLGCHIFLLEYDAATSLAPRALVESVLRGAASLGAERLIVSGASVGAGNDKLQRKAEALNAYGKQAKAAGLTLCYHNHDLEFSNHGAEIEEMLRLTAPELVHLMLDAGHAWRAKTDVSAFFSRHAARIDGLHLRDYRNGDQVPLGGGEFDLRPLAFAIRKLQWPGWIINEEERLNGVKPGDDAVEPARAQLRKSFGV